MRKNKDELARLQKEAEERAKPWTRRFAECLLDRTKPVPHDVKQALRELGRKTN